MSQLRILVVIPTFNNDATINQVIGNILELTNLPILLVDDGSDKNLSESIEQQYLSNSRLDFFRLEDHQGQGAAIQAAFSYAIKKNYTHVVTMNADGQHNAFEIPLLTSAAKTNPFSIIVGSREAVSSTEPVSNKISKRAANFWNKLSAKYQTDAKVVDAQSGFRCYPLFFMQNMNFKFKELDFDIEVLIRSIWNGVDIKNIKTSVVYDPNMSSNTTTKNLKDSLKMMSLRATLVVVSLITEPTSPFQSALAVAIGVFVGVLPIFGLHAAIVAAISIVFRINFIYLWLGTHISTPPLFPFVVYGSNLIGKEFFDYFYHQQSGLILTTVIGSIILGVILAVVAFVSVYLIKRKISLREKSFEKNDPFRSKNSAVLAFLQQNTNIKFLNRMVPTVALVSYLFSFKIRKAGAQYWKLVQPQAGFFEIQRNIYRQILIDLKCQAEEIAQKKMNPESFNTVNQSNWRLADKKHIIISGHVGNFRQIERMVDQQTQPFLVDRCTSKRVELALFLKKIAPFDSTAFRVAAAYKLSIEFIFIIYQDSGKFKTCSFHPVMNEKLNHDENISDLLSQYVMILENLLKIYPDQWLNFYHYWSMAPHITIKHSAEHQPIEIMEEVPLL